MGEALHNPQPGGMLTNTTILRIVIEAHYNSTITGIVHRGRSNSPSSF